MHLRNNKGFTLIELLVVVAIIGLLASVVLASLNSARAKARDAKVRTEFSQLQKALALYFDKYGRYPNEFGSHILTNPWTDNFNNMAAQLVAEKFLASVPIAPTNHIYNYYNYGGSIGGILVSSLETITPTMIPPFNSCRPFGNNWCSNTIATTDYCICNPY